MPDRCWFLRSYERLSNNTTGTGKAGTRSAWKRASDCSHHLTIDDRIGVSDTANRGKVALTFAG